MLIFTHTTHGHAGPHLSIGFGRIYRSIGQINQHLPAKHDKSLSIT